MSTIQKYARLNAQGVVQETFTPVDDITGAAVPIEAVFRPEVAAQFVPCPAGVVPGSTKNGDVWTPPAPVPPAPVTLVPLTPMQFYLAFAPSERIGVKNSLDPVVKEFWDTYERAERTNTPIDPNSPAVQGGLTYLAQPTTAKPPGPGILASQARIAQILAGVAQ